MARDKNLKVQDEHEEIVPAHSATDDEANERAADGGQQSQTTGAGDPRDQVVRLQAERDALFDRLARQQAEFENQRKRNAREQTEFRDYATANTLKSLLPILDNFDLALKAGNTNPNDLRKGLELIRRQMDEVLTKLGVEPINAKGEPFDPRYHEAIEMAESSDVSTNPVLDDSKRDTD